jgi:hypothetical protein
MIEFGAFLGVKTVFLCSDPSFFVEYEAVLKRKVLVAKKLADFSRVLTGLFDSNFALEPMGTRSHEAQKRFRNFKDVLTDCGIHS